METALPPQVRRGELPSGGPFDVDRDRRQVERLDGSPGRGALGTEPLGITAYVDAKALVWSPDHV